MHTCMHSSQFVPSFSFFLVFLVVILACSMTAISLGFIFETIRAGRPSSQPAQVQLIRHTHNGHWLEQTETGKSTQYVDASTNLWSMQLSSLGNIFTSSNRRLQLIQNTCQQYECIKLTSALFPFSFLCALDFVRGPFNSVDKTRSPKISRSCCCNILKPSHFIASHSFLCSFEAELFRN